MSVLTQEKIYQIIDNAIEQIVKITPPFNQGDYEHVIEVFAERLRAWAFEQKAECPYCKELHDTRVACPEYIAQTN